MNKCLCGKVKRELYLRHVGDKTQMRTLRRHRAHIRSWEIFGRKVLLLQQLQLFVDRRHFIILFVDRLIINSFQMRSIFGQMSTINNFLFWWELEIKRNLPIGIDKIKRVGLAGAMNRKVHAWLLLIWRATKWFFAFSSHTRTIRWRGLIRI